MSKNKTPKNNRKFPREKVEIEVEIKFLEEAARTVFTRNLSLGGMFICLDDAEHYTMGEMLFLRFKHPLDNDKDTRKESIVVRHADGGIAVAFVEIEGF